MEFLIVILVILLILLGIAGCFLPVIPGPPVAYMALLLLHLTTDVQFSSQQLWILGILSVVVQLIDYIVPIWGTRKFGGTKAGIRGSTIGLVVGVFILPLLGIVIGPFGLVGILAGPFIGAYLGETMTGKNQEHALKAAAGSFIGFLTGTLIKLILTLILSFFVFKALFNLLF